MKAIRVVAVAIVVFAALWFQRPHAPAAPPVPDGAASPQAQQPTPKTPANDLVVRNITVRDMDGRVAWHGDVDLAPHLARATSGARDAHRNDGGVFANRERLLPAQRRGYYHEYVIRTEGIDHAGPQRMIVGDGGEVFYTADHYASFRRVR